MCEVLAFLHASTRSEQMNQSRLVGGPEMTLDIGQSLTKWPIKPIKPSVCQSMTHN